MLLLIGCGGDSTPRPRSSPGFINQTAHSDANLWKIWTEAQNHLAKTIDLNPIQRQFAAAPADIRPGDSRALQITPQQLRVTPVADVTAAELLAGTGTIRTDPTGLIACRQPCNVRYAAAYSVYSPPAVNYAASWEAHEDSFAPMLQYEFENQILFTMGYDVRWR